MSTKLKLLDACHFYDAVEQHLIETVLMSI